MGVRLHLMRHGLIRANVKGLWHGSTDSPLIWRGRRQAKRTGAYLAKLADQRGLRFAAVYSSPLQRCVTTAQLVTAHQPVDIVTLPGLAEMDIGEWEDRSFRWLKEEHDFINRMTRDPSFAPPGGESLDRVAERVCQAFEYIDAEHQAHQHVLVISHGVTMGVALATLLDDQPGKWVNYHFNNCGVTQFELNPAPMVLSFNQHAHL